MTLNDRFWRKADIGLVRGERLLLTQSGHSDRCGVFNNDQSEHFCSELAGATDIQKSAGRRSFRLKEAGRVR